MIEQNLMLTLMFTMSISLIVIGFLLYKCLIKGEAFNDVVVTKFETKFETIIVQRRCLAV